MKISDLYKVASSKRVLKSDWKSEGIPFYRGREITTLSKSGYVENELYITEEMYKDFSSNYGIPVANDIMITAIGTIGNTFIVRESDKFYFKDASVLWLKKIKEVNSNFVNYWFKSRHFTNQLDVGLGATVDSLTIGKVQSLKINVPPIPVQDKLVSKLDAIFTEIDKAVAAADANAKNVEALFQSQLGEIITGEDDWSLYTLREVCDIARGGSPRPIDKFITELEDGINWVKISDATRSKKYIYETRQKIKKEGVSRSRFVNDGDFLLSNSMSFGRPYIMRTTGCIHDGWLVLSKYQKHLDIDFFYYLLSSPVIVSQFENLAKGSTVRNLNIELVSRVRIKIPSIQKQKMIVAKLNQISTEIDNLKNFYQKKEIQLKLFKQSILKKAFNGELVKAA
jgi:type I restriction enzyme, S subunit